MHTPQTSFYPTAPERQRAHGVTRLRLGGEAGATRILDLFESGPARLRFPKRHGGELEAVQMNVAGGIACGDRFESTLLLEPGARAVLTTAAAEKIYRSDGPDSLITNRVALEDGARLAFLPQETILFDHARLRRRLEVDLAGNAHLMICEIVAFGRVARGERMGTGAFSDNWRIRRGGRLAYADSVRLDGPIADLLDRAAVGGGARALATILDCAPGAEGRIEEARGLLQVLAADGVEAGASAWNGHLAVRLLGPNVGDVRMTAARWLAAYRGERLPRVWQT